MEEHKKRHLLPLIQASIAKLTEMALDASKLEYYDNDQASRRLKRAIVDYENNEHKNFKKAVSSIRENININKKQIKKQKSES